MRRPRAVVDTNVLVSGIIRSSGNPYSLIELWKVSQFTLVTTDELLAEFIEVMTRTKLVTKYPIIETVFPEILDLIRLTAKVAKPINKLPFVLRDFKDDKVLYAALGGNARFLVSGDNDLLAIRGNSRLDKLKVVTVKEFLQIIKQES